MMKTFELIQFWVNNNFNSYINDFDNNNDSFNSYNIVIKAIIIILKLTTNDR